jgi:hypothetical protein
MSEHRDHGPAAARRIVLVGCGAKKLEHPAAARELYTSNLFRLSAQYAEERFDAWYILSGAHGLVEPDRELGPYDWSLRELRVSEREGWGARAAAMLLHDEPGVAAEGTHHGLLLYNGMPGFVRELDDAIGTITSRDKQALLMPSYRADIPRSLGEPAGTLTTRSHEALVISDADVDECFLRMLQWPELLRAQVMQTLPDGEPYLLTARRRNKRGKFVELSNELRTQMIGNAVSRPVGTLLGAAVVESLLGITLMEASN